MAHWSNPKTRKIGHHIYNLIAEGMHKSEATRQAKAIREGGNLARVVEDERLGRYDVSERGPFYCVYYKRVI
jgi:hypothetical protein